MNVRTFLAATALFAVGLFGASSARAASCSDVVGDDARILSDVSRVQAAASELRSRTRGVVRVRTTDTLLGADNLAPYLQRQIASCPEWKGSNGGANLIVLALYRNPSTGAGKAEVLSGDNFSGTLNRSSLDVIRKQHIGPQFKAGNYSGAAVAGLNAIGTVIAGVPVAVAPQTAPTPAPIPVQPSAAPVIPQNVVPAPAPIPAPVPQVVVAPAPAAPGSNVGLFVLLGVLAVAGIVALVYFRRRAAADRAEVQGAVRQKSSSVTTELLNFMGPEVELLQNQVEVASSGCDQADADELTRLLKAYTAGIAAARSKDVRVRQSVDVDRNDLTTAQLRMLDKGFGEVLDDVATLKTQQAAVENKLSELKRKGDQAKPAVEGLVAKAKAAADAIATAVTEGFKVDALNDDLSAAAGVQKQARDALSNGRAVAAKTLADDAAAKFAAVVAAAKGLAARKAAILGRTATADVDKAGQQSVVSALATLRLMQDKYAETSLETVAGYEAGIAANITQASAQVTSAKEQTASQDWAAAEKALTEAETLLGNVDSMARSIMALSGNLEKAAARAPAALSDARRDVASARSFIKTNAADIEDKLEDGLLENLTTAETALPGQTALAAARPDYPAIIAAAQAASKAAAGVLSRAKSDQENTLRLRRLAATAIATAEAKIATTAEYLEDHRSVIGTRIRDSRPTWKGDAERMVRAARTHSDPAEQVRLAESATTAVEGAYGAARQIVRSHEEAVARAERQRQRRLEEARLDRERRDSAGDLLTGAVLGAAAATILNGDSSRRSRTSVVGGDDDLGSNDRFSVVGGDENLGNSSDDDL